jgi:tetrahydromethanopterin S-methyltransferase subunit A
MTAVFKADPAPGYPPEEGCFLRGNDYSPVAVCVILKWDRERTPPDIEQAVRTGIESGAALSGTLQTENIGMEKMICNIVSNPNIRYLVVCGPESPGHRVGDAIVSLKKNGLDADKRIIGAKAPTPYLFNIPEQFVERFRQQVEILDLTNIGSPDSIRQAVWSCYQETPTEFLDYQLCDPGAFPEPPLDGSITWRITHPEREPKTPQEHQDAKKLKALMERIMKSIDKRRDGK